MTLWYVASHHLWFEIGCSGKPFSIQFVVSLILSRYYLKLRQPSACFFIGPLNRSYGNGYFLFVQVFSHRQTCAQPSPSL